MHICGFGTEVVRSNAYSGIELHVEKQIINFLKYAHSNSEFQPSMMRILPLERKYWINTCLMNSLVTLRVLICSL